MKWLQSPENQAKRDSDISWDSHGKKNAERACSPLSRCLVGESWTGLLIPLLHCVRPSLAQTLLFQLCKHTRFARTVMILWILTGAMGIAPWVAAIVASVSLDHVVLVNPSRPFSFMNVMDDTPAYPILGSIPCPVPWYTPALDWHFLTGPHYWWSTQYLHWLGCIQWKMTWISICSLSEGCWGLLCDSHSTIWDETVVEPSSSQFSHLTRNKVSWLLSCAEIN